MEEDLRADGRKISVQCSGIFTDWMRKLGSRQGAKPEKNGLPFGAGCIFGGIAAKSAFALLLTKVTKLMCLFGIITIDKRGGVFIGEND